MNDVSGKVALVTGASAGIGLACARILAEEGYRIFTAQRRGAEGFESIAADFSDPSSPQQVVESLDAAAGRLDVLVNNAGVMFEADAEETALAEWNLSLAVNLTAPFLLIKHGLPLLRVAGGGSIINIGSIEGLGANPRHPAYCASKAGLHGLTKAIAVDHGKDNIRCNAVAPGWIDTELNNAFIESMDDPVGFKNKIGGIHPVRRTGTPEEVAALVSWLASEKASFVTGQIYTIDGGRTSKLSLP